jgi:hypothetical protein
VECHHHRATLAHLGKRSKIKVVPMKIVGMNDVRQSGVQQLVCARVAEIFQTAKPIDNASRFGHGVRQSTSVSGHA